jgi:hypothetical protein
LKRYPVLGGFDERYELVGLVGTGIVLEVGGPPPEIISFEISDFGIDICINDRGMRLSHKIVVSA